MNATMLMILWGVAIVVLVVVEIFTLGLTTIWFAAGALAALILAALGAPIVVQVLVFAIVSIVLLYFTRPVISKWFNKTRIKTNAEGLVGKHAYVIEEIDNIKATGKIKVDGMEWTARTEKDGMAIPKDALITIKKIEGVRAIVEQNKEEN